ncbi:MAG: hypothetical protein P1V51_20090 [Deltaproteobacteria bacterium]|nr:hypothetical protein [Deltaproteobacteria bacterium]
MSYVPATDAHNIRFDYELFGGPRTASYTVATAVASGIALGTIQTLGSHWVGEVITKKQVDNYRTEIILSGLSRRLERMPFRGLYNCTDSDGTARYGSTSVTDVVQILAYLQPLVQTAGLTIDAGSLYPTLTSGIRPDEADISGSVRDTLTSIAQACQKTWYVSQTTSSGRRVIYLTGLSQPGVPTPTEESTENIKNILIIEGRPRKYVDESGMTDAQKWARYTELNDQTGLTGYADGQARFYSDRKQFAYANLASVSTYGRREERVQVPYIGDTAAALNFATKWLGVFAGPVASSESRKVIQSPTSASGEHEKMPWEVGVGAVSVDVLPTGGATVALKCSYTVSSGDRLNSLLRKGDFVKPIENHRDWRIDLLDRWQRGKRGTEAESFDGSHAKPGSIPNTALAGYPWNFLTDPTKIDGGVGNMSVECQFDDDGQHIDGTVAVLAANSKTRFRWDADGTLRAYANSGANEGIATNWTVAPDGSVTGTLKDKIQLELTHLLIEGEADFGPFNGTIKVECAYVPDDGTWGSETTPGVLFYFADGGGNPYVVGWFDYLTAMLHTQGVRGFTGLPSAPASAWTIEADGSVTGTLRDEILAISTQAVTASKLSYTDLSGETAVTVDPSKRVLFTYAPPGMPAVEHLSVDIVNDQVLPFADMAGYQHGGKTVLGASNRTFKWAYIQNVEGWTSGLRKWGIDENGNVALGLKDSVVKTIYGGLSALPNVENTIAYAKANGTTGRLAGPANQAVGTEYALGIVDGVIQWVAGGVGGGGNVDKIQDPDDATTRLQIDDATGKLQYFSANTLVAEFDSKVSTKGFRYYDSGGGYFQVKNNGEVARYDSGNNLVWKIGTNGVMAGIKVGFKQG